MSEEQSQFKFSLENVNKPLSESEISQKIQNEKNEANFMSQLSEPYYKGLIRISVLTTISLFVFILIILLIDICSSLITSSFNISHILIRFLLFLSMIASVPIISALVIFVACNADTSLQKDRVKKMTNDPNYIFNDDLLQLNHRLVDKNEPYKVRYLHELIKENKYVHYDTSINDLDKTGILTITLDDNFKKFNKDDYSSQDLDFINQYNSQYRLDSNKDAIQFFEQYMDQYIDKEFLNSRFDAQSLQEIHDKSEKIKHLSQRN